MPMKRIETPAGDVIEVYGDQRGGVVLAIKQGEFSTVPLAREHVMALADALVEALHVEIAPPLDVVSIEVGYLPEVSDGDWGDVLPIRIPEGQIINVRAVRGLSGKVLAVSLETRVHRWGVGGYTNIQAYYSPTDSIKVLRDEAVNGIPVVQ